MGAHEIGSTPLAHNPGLSFPEAMGTEGQLEALYRFLNNEDVTFEAVHAPHAEQTRLRCQAQDRVLVLHDTTLLKFNGDREGLGRIYEEGGARGFRLHASLAVTPTRRACFEPKRGLGRRHLAATETNAIRVPILSESRSDGDAR